MKLIVLGPPGVGKGTIAEKLKEKANLMKLSTGDLFRENIKQGTELGKKANMYIKEGKLVPDDLTIDIIKDRIQGKDNYILDGFPRTVPQAEALDTFAKIDYVVNFKANDAEIIKRLSGRRTCPSCKSNFNIQTLPPKAEGICDNCGSKLIQRDDDKPETIKKRLEVYKNQTEPLIEYYKKKKILVEVNAEQAPEKVFQDTLKALGLK
jgi:adenylate kinase